MIILVQAVVKAESGQHQSYGNAEVYGWSESTEIKKVPCSVCYRKHRSAVMMIPGMSMNKNEINLKKDM